MPTSATAVHGANGRDDDAAAAAARAGASEQNSGKDSGAADDVPKKQGKKQQEQQGKVEEKDGKGEEEEGKATTKVPGQEQEASQQGHDDGPKTGVDGDDSGAAAARDAALDAEPVAKQSMAIISKVPCTLVPCLAVMERWIAACACSPVSMCVCA